MDLFCISLFAHLNLIFSLNLVPTAIIMSCILLFPQFNTPIAHYKNNDFHFLQYHIPTSIGLIVVIPTLIV